VPHYVVSAQRDCPENCPEEKAGKERANLQVQVNGGAARSRPDIPPKAKSVVNRLGRQESDTQINPTLLAMAGVLAMAMVEANAIHAR